MLQDCVGHELHSFRVNESQFDVPVKYIITEPVGQGAYGIVCAARNEEKGEDVAIKKIENAFEHMTFTRRTLRELRILRFMKHENIVGIKEIFLPKSKAEFTDIYVVSELMETDLASILKSNQPLTSDHCQFFLYQLLRGLKYIHSANIIHRDLKPRNLLVNSNCDLKICDFGLSRVNFNNEDNYHHAPLTEYVCTRWYRAPEILCSWSDYTAAIDMWSVGCIFAEMLNRKPLFPGHNTQHQLQLIVKLIGSPTKEELTRISNEKCRKFVSQIEASKRRNFREIFPSAPPDANSLLEKTLAFDPKNRLTSAEALEHAYVASLHCPQDEPSRLPLSTKEFEFERRKVDTVMLREELYQEMLRYCPGQMEEYFNKNQGRIPDVKGYKLMDNSTIIESVEPSSNEEDTAHDPPPLSLPPTVSIQTGDPNHLIPAAKLSV